MEKKLYYDLILLDSGFSRMDKKGDDKVDVFELRDGKWSITDSSEDSVGHGTSVMSLVSNSFDGKFAVFKVFTSVTLSNIDNILLALNYILENISCKYIQMSFGVRGYDRALQDVCEKLYKKGVMIIAAYDNCGAMSYPAAFDFVIGVSGNPLIKRKDQFVVQNNSLVDIYAKSGKQIVTSATGKGFLPAEGNSFAASYVSLALLKNGGCYRTKEETMGFFMEDYQQAQVEKTGHVFGKKVSVFPLNKEVYSLINYSEMLTVDLVDVYDVKYSSNLGRNISSIEGNVSYEVKNIDKCEYGSFDTLIIGHVRELSDLLNRDIKKELLEKCIANKKNVYCFDRIHFDEYKEKFKEHGLVLECADDYQLRYKEGRLYQSKTPILAVVGTNKKQGKFTLQMQIKKVLEENDVKLAVLGTEPTSMLLGCDDILPLGYDAEISSHTADYIIEAFNDKIHNLDILDKDLILVGGQSGFLPHITFNVGHININQFPFLYGVIPDGIIMTITDTDEIEYVKKSIRVLEALFEGKVFMLALYAFHTESDYVINVKKRKLSEDEVEAIRKKYKEETGLDVVVSGEPKDNQILFDNIIKYYCS